MDVVETRMLKWMSQNWTLRNERIIGTTNVGDMLKKVHENRIKQYRNVMRREED